MRNLLISAILASAIGTITLLVTFPLSIQHMVAMALLTVAIATTIIACNRFLQEREQQKSTLNATLQRQENIIRQQNDGLQTYLANLESFVKLENELIIKKIISMEAEIATLIQKFSSFNSTTSSRLTSQDEGLERLKKSVQNMGVLLTTFSKAQENFRSKAATAFKELKDAASKQAEQQNQELVTLEELSTKTETEFAAQKIHIKTIHSLLRDTASALQTLQQESESQFEHQSNGRDALAALLTETRSQVEKLQKVTATSFTEQSKVSTAINQQANNNYNLIESLHTETTELSTAQQKDITALNLGQTSLQNQATGQQECLTRIEKGQLSKLAEIDQTITKLEEEVTSSVEAIRLLAEGNSSDFAKQQLSSEILAQLLAENETSLTALHTISQDNFSSQQKHLQAATTLLVDIKNENNTELANQTQVLTALNSKIGSQQNAVVAAMRQVEHSHRPQGRLEGDLTNMALPDLLQILQLAKKTASIFLKEIDGAIYLEKGLLVYVRQGKFAGIQAFIRIMMILHGYFSVRFDTLPSSLPKKPRPLIPELLSVITEVDEIKNNLSDLTSKIEKESGLNNFLVQLPAEGIDKAILATFNYQAPAQLEELVILMGKGVQENITILDELHDNGQLTLIS